MADWDEPQNPTPARADSAAYSAEITRLRTELEAVKREAVDVLKPFATQARGFDFGSKKGVPDGFRITSDLTVGHLRAARAFVENHRRDG